MSVYQLSAMRLQEPQQDFQSEILSARQHARAELDEVVRVLLVVLHIIVGIESQLPYLAAAPLQLHEL